MWKYYNEFQIQDVQTSYSDLVHISANQIEMDSYKLNLSNAYP